jgi:hypothetical protein
MVAIYIDIQQPIDATINQSYAPFGFYKFGLGCWQYQASGPGVALPVAPSSFLSGGVSAGGVYDGEIEWINTLQFTSQPKYANPVGFRYMLLGKTSAIVRLLPTPNGIAAPNVGINGVPYNPTTGLNMPLNVD